MTPLHAGRRRAERFAGLVDGSVDSSSEGAPGGAADPGMRDLLALVGALRGVPETQPRPEFVADLRSQLMEAARSTAPSGGTVTTDRAVSDRLTITPRRRPRERRLAVAVGALAILGATTSMAVASQSALPGDALYPLKLAIEDTHTSLSVGDEAKGSTVLQHAGDRLGEARDLSRGGADAGRVTSTLQSFDDQAAQGSTLLITDFRANGDQSSINEIRDFAVASIAQLDELDGIVPDAAHPAVVAAAKQVFLIDARAGELCPTCTSTGITEMPGTLLSSGTLTRPAPALPTTGPTTAPRGTTGPQTLPTGNVSIPPSLIPTARPTAAASTSAAPSAPATVAPPSAAASSSGPLDSVTGHASKLPSPALTPSAIVSGASAVVSNVASAVGGVVSGAASGVGSLLNGLLGSSQAP